MRTRWPGGESSADRWSGLVRRAQPLGIPFRIRTADLNCQMPSIEFPTTHSAVLRQELPMTSRPGIPPLGPPRPGSEGLLGWAAGDAIAADKRVTAIARTLHDGGAPGTLDQLRAAVFVALLAGRDPASLIPQAHAGSPESTNSGPGGLAAMTGTVHLVMPAAAWLGLSDAPGEVAGFGPLNPWTCDPLAGHPDRPRRPRGRARHPCRPGPPGSRLAWLAGLQFDWLERGTLSPSPPGPPVRARAAAGQPGPSPAAAVFLPRMPPSCSRLRPGSHAGLPPRRPTCECNLSPA